MMSSCFATWPSSWRTRPGAARLAGLEPDAAAAQGHRVAARVISHPGAVVPADAMADLLGP
jgi:hypothetical protein